MTPVKQRFRHDPDNGIWGDCHRAAIASALDLPLDDVPHFHDQGDTRAHHKIEEWLNGRGLTAVNILYNGNCDCRDLLTTIANCNHMRTRPLVYLLTGASRNGTDHVVVCVGDEVVHDPALDESGIVGPSSDGMWWVTFFGAFLATAPGAPA